MSDEHGDAKLNEDATFDPNVWYAISEARVDQAGQDFHHNLQFNSDLNPPDFKVFPDENHLYWQIIPIDGEAKNRWHLRSQKTGSKFHLATCINPKEVHPDKTGLCMLQADEDADNQKWEATQWGDGTSGVRFINVGNGTNYWLDCHKGSPPFMSDDIDTAVWQPAQRWLFSSVSAVEEASLQVGDGSPTMTGGANTGPTDDALPGPEDATEDAAAADDGSGLSTGASAGIGVGVGVAVLAIIAAVFFLLRRRKKNAGEAAAAAAVQNYHEVPGAAVKGDGPTYEKGGDTPASSVPIAEAPTRDTGAQEIDGTTHVVPHLFPMELDSTEVPHSPGSTRFTVSPTLSPAPAPAPPMSPMNPNHR